MSASNDYKEGDPLQEACAICGERIPPDMPSFMTYVRTKEHPEPFWIQIHTWHGRVTGHGPAEPLRYIHGPEDVVCEKCSIELGLSDE